MYVCAATGKDPVRERLLENEKNNFKLVAEKVCLSPCINFVSTCTMSLSSHSPSCVLSEEFLCWL